MDNHNATGNDAQGEHPKQEPSHVQNSAHPQVRLWTAWSVYQGTGEGVTMLARIDHAESEADSREAFEAAFGSFWSCTVEPGVVRNEVTARLFPEKTLDWVAGTERRAKVQLEGRLHFNLA